MRRIASHGEITEGRLPRLSLWISRRRLLFTVLPATGFVTAAQRPTIRSLNTAFQVAGPAITTVVGGGSLGNGGPATSAKLSTPSGVALDGLGNLYIADCYYHNVRMVSAAGGTISTVAGSGTPGYSGDG